jgi:hypothetical protein
MTRPAASLLRAFDASLLDCYRSPLVAWSCQNFCESKAFADAAAPVKTDRAIMAERMVFMIVPLGSLFSLRESSLLALEIWRVARLRTDVVTHP